MPFRGLVRGRRLEIVGSNGQKIIADPGTPVSIKFYTGSPDETAPGELSMSFDPVPNPDTLEVHFASPDLAAQNPAVLTLRTLAGGASAGINTSGLYGTTLVDDATGIYASFSPTDIKLGDVVGGTNSIFWGGLDVNKALNANLNFKLPNGRRITGIGGNNGVSDNCSGGNGTLNYAHDFGTDNFSIIPIRQGAANQIMSRITSGDTSTTFQCRVQNNDGTSPANGTAISISWLGISWAP